jgi:hypothetical protein
MRFMVIVKYDESKGITMPDERILAQMQKYNEELANAGVLLAAEGLLPSADGAMIKFNGDKREVVDGPFGGGREMIAGFWLIQASSKQEAIDWVKRAPNPFPGESELELRKVSETEDFDAMTPEMREREKQLARQIAENARR